LGWELQRSLAVLGQVVAPGHHDAGLCGDLTRLDQLAETVRTVKPDVVVNAAAYTAVDKAESEPELAMLINAAAPGVMAHAANVAGAWMVHYSTDYVFDGRGSKPWQEDDQPAPLNAYGISKLEGERLVAMNCERHLLLRTSWVYASRGGNFARTMLRLASERESLAVVDDQFGAPTGADLLADLTAHAVPVAMSAPAMAGLYHVAARGETSWNGYARFVIEQARMSGKALTATPETVERVASSAFKTLAVRPLNSRLDTARFTSTFGLTLPAWQDGVARMLSEIH
jgi:dTDP-4-dehydrorhamnose reductase